MGHGLQQFLPFGRIIDLGEFLRQIQVIPADDAILDEPFAGCSLSLLDFWDAILRPLVPAYRRSNANDRA